MFPCNAGLCFTFTKKVKMKFPLHTSIWINALCRWNSFVALMKLMEITKIFRKKMDEVQRWPQGNKLSHIILARYASAVWDDIRLTMYCRSKTVRRWWKNMFHPLQLDVIDRLVDLYSLIKWVVATPFMGSWAWFVAVNGKKSYWYWIKRYVF